MVHRFQFLAALLLSSLLLVSPLASTVLVHGNITSTTQTFSVPITTKAYDRQTGIFYVGLTAGAEAFSIARAQRPIFGQTTSFAGIAPASVTSLALEFMHLASTFAGRDSVLVVSLLNNATPFTQTQLITMENNGTNSKTSDPLLDAGGAPGDNGLVTDGIVAISASNNPTVSFSFAAVRANAGVFGGTMLNNGGIAVLRMDQETLELDQTAAQATDSGIKAIKLTLDTPNVFIAQQLVDITENEAHLWWDDILKRLYIGLSITTNTAMSDGGRSIVVADVSNSGVMTFTNIAPDGAFDPAENNIVGVINPGASSETVTTHHVRTMHTTAGPAYLIVNGGRSTSGGVGNTIYALPLVNNPLIPAHGTIADKNSIPVRGNFITPASTQAEMTNATDSFAQVGAGPLPIEPDQTISDIVVSADTVYVSIDLTQTALNDTGIFSSQALFDESGKIIRWTSWQRQFPFNGFPDGPIPGAVALFDVDDVSAIVWAVEGGADCDTVRTTGWVNGTRTSLPAELNKILIHGSCHMLDLGQTTRGFLNATAQRYALFSGSNNVIFARISQAFDSTSLNSSQEIITDFSIAQNFLVTQLPTNGPITELEYARQLPGITSNYFFAGTNNGLFVFADPTTGSGFDSSTLQTLAQPPFSTYTWQKIDTIPGAIVDVKTSGNTLYVLTSQPTPARPLYQVLYRVDFDTDIATMFNASNIIPIAITGDDVFANTLMFNDLQIIGTDATGSTEQLVLATNQGLFRSSRVGGVQAATDQTDAAWQLIRPNNNLFYTTIGAPNTDIPVNPAATIWPIALTPDARHSFARSVVFQLNGNTDAGQFTFVPQSFVSNSADPALRTLPVIISMWSDGSRRIFITSPTTCNNPTSTLLSFPYFSNEWGITQNGDRFALRDITIDQVGQFYWVNMIGASGIMLAGTSKGVVALQ